MEALVHICRDGCRTIGPHDKVLRDDQAPCEYAACKGLEALIRHFAGCKMRGPGGCIHCKRMWQILELHSRICANSDACKVPLCRSFLVSLYYATKIASAHGYLKLIFFKEITGYVPIPRRESKTKLIFFDVY